MIDPKLLTKEAGFEYGVVVEIVWEDYLSNKREFYVWGSDVDHPQKEYMITQYGASIRPLTGPMAIWNEYIDKPEIGWIVRCSDHSIDAVWHGQEDGWMGSVLIPRPFWANHG